MERLTTPSLCYRMASNAYLPVQLEWAKNCSFRRHMKKLCTRPSTPLVVMLLCLTVWPAFGQNQDFRLTAQYQDQPLIRILESVEKASKLRFYFQTEKLPDHRHSYVFSDATLEEVMEKILTPTNLGFIRYKDNVVLVPAQIARQQFSVNYYEAREQATRSVEEEASRSIGNINDLANDGLATLSGTVLDVTDAPIIGASVSIKNLEIGTITDVDGRFELQVPAGLHYVNVSYVGFEDMNESLRVLSSGELTYQLEKGAINLEEIVVSAKSLEGGVEDAQISITTLNAEAIKETPTFLGEADVVKTLLLNAGVSSVGEGASGFNVRGGDVDQNLILQDNGLLLNSSHALGFFSFFNADFIDEVKLYKAIMPAQYGGRLSSVLDVKTKEGDYEQFKLRAGVGPVTSRLTLEGPIVKDKISIIGGGRASYADWILRQVQDLDVSASSAFFYDANLKISAKLSPGTTLMLSGYSSTDEFTFSDQFGFDYSNQSAQFLLRNTFSNSLISNFSVAYNKYESTRSDFDPVRGSSLANDVDNFKIKERITFSPTTAFRLDAGFSSILYNVEPGTLEPTETSIIIGRTVEDERGLESALFANMEYDVSENLTISAGLRYSDFRFLGPATVREYSDEDTPREEQVVGETTYSSGDVIANYNNFEPRFSLRYKVGALSSVKMGYSRTVQYINQIFNSDSPTPVSQWQLSNSFIVPNTSHNYSLGYFRYIKDRRWETNAEIYYRSLDQLFDYKDFATLTANPNIETEILDGIGRTYGFEFTLNKKEGIINGSINYTYSRSERQIEGINRGDWYPSNFDKPHDLAFVFNYQPNRRNTLTLNFIYSSGRPTTPPAGNFEYVTGLVIPIYANRNAARIPDYHRLDIAYTIGRGYKRDRKFRTSWTLSLYNVYSRRNAFTVFFTQGPQQGAVGNKLSILGSVFPSLTFNLEVN